MNIKGEELIQAPISTVWEGLNSNDILLKSIPGCEEIERTSDSELQAKVMIKLGPVKARFSGKVSMSNIRPQEGYTLHFEGSGGAAGFAKGSADIQLVNENGATRLTYTANASVGGKLGQIGSRLIEGSAKKLSGEFFAAFAEAVAPGHRALSVHSGEDSALSRAEQQGIGTGVSGTPANANNMRLWLSVAIAIAVIAVAASVFSSQF